ncbi:MAG: hypothetical protein FD151_1971 [bacterium]|nr:MAG: hypothetical protein FD151_1971 [bacterium]
MKKEFYELVIEGPYILIKGFITGLLIGSKKMGTVIYNKEKDIKRESLSELLKEWIGISEHLTHVIISSDIYEMVTRGIETSFDDINMKIISSKKIRKVRFRFKYEAFAEKYGIELKNFFKDLPSGVSLLPDYNPVEEIHKEAKGVEIYAPEHDYKISAEGSVEGPLLEIIGLYEQAKEKVLIELKEITLHFEE